MAVCVNKKHSKALWNTKMRLISTALGQSFAQRHDVTNLEMMRTLN